MSLEKFIELTLPLGHVATTTKRENTLLRNQKNIPILDKYKEADIKKKVGKKRESEQVSFEKKEGFVIFLIWIHVHFNFFFIFEK